MEFITILKTNFTIFIGIFVTLAVMGTTTLYDRYKSKGGASFDREEFKHLLDLKQKITAIGSEGLRQFSEYSKKLGSLFRKDSGPGQNKSSLRSKKFSLNRSNSRKINLEKVETILLKAKDTLQKLFVNFRNKISSMSFASIRKNNHDDENFISVSDNKNTNSKLGVTDKVNNLEKVVESKKSELDFDDDLLTNMPTSGTLTGTSTELKTAEPSALEMSSDLDRSYDNDLKIDENEFAIKVDGLDNKPDENNFSFNENSPEIKFDEESDKSDNLLASLKKDIVVKTEKKINFMDNMQGNDLDLKVMKSDLEAVLKDLNKYKHFTNHN